MPYRKYLLIFLVLLWGCSTKKNTWLSRTYHNMTARYNVYFNGKESYKAGIEAIRENHKDNYNKILPMFEESDEDAAQAAASDMDRAIEKGTKLIVRHSITARPKKRKNSSSKKDFYHKKEYNNLVDDALLLIGKAQVVKHDFRQAIKTFDLLIRDFPHEETKYKALIWKARAYTDLGDFNNAHIALERYDLDGKAPEYLYGKFMEVYANLLLNEEKYNKAVPVLQHAIDGIDQRYDKARYSFILGQLKQFTGDDEGAALAYEKALKYRPDYEMAFNAQLRSAAIAYRDASLEEIKKKIKKMLRDKKNEEFRDQIYYVLGKVYLKFDDKTEAVNSFKKSTEVSVSNDYQKTLSYLALADIYFKDEMYKPSYLYYDSAMTVMSEDFSDYDVINERKNTLQLLVAQLDIINREDSLIMLADLSDAEREKFIENIIETAKEKAKKEQRSSGIENIYYGGGGSYQNYGVQSGTGEWYFYNVTAKELGKQEFKQVWGNRKLTDNWRWSQKSNMGAGDITQEPVLPENPTPPGVPPGEGEKPKGQAETGQTAQSPQKNVTGGIPTKESLLADIPLTPEAYRNAELSRDLSKYEAGMVFLEQLKNYPRAIRMFEECLASKVIPEDDKEKVYIALYKAYDANNDSTNKLLTLNNLKKHFPNSKFIQYLEDPDFLAKIKAKQKMIDDEYATTYAEYLTGKYDTVIYKANEVAQNDTSNIYLPKYILIKALSYARKGETNQFKLNLENLTTNYPGTEEARFASAFLEQLAQGRTPVKSAQPYQSLLRERAEEIIRKEGKKQKPAEPETSGFIYAENEQHSFVALPPAGTDINRIVFNLADFNFSRYLVDDYSIETTRLPDNSPVILINGFSNKLEGMDYFYAVREHENKLFLNDTVKTKLFVISKTNLKLFLSSGQVINYTAFFDKYYLKPVNVEELPESVLKKPEKEITESIPDSLALKDSTLTVTPEIQQSTETSTGVTGKATTEKTVQPVTKTQTEQKKPETTGQDKVTTVKTEKQKEQQKETATSASKKKQTGKAQTGPPVTKKPEPENIKPSPWVFNASSPQEVNIIFRKSRLDYKKILKNYNSFTRNYYSKDSLKVEMKDFQENYKCITVSGFKDKEQAVKYTQDISKSAILLRDIQNREYYIWAITPENKATLEENKDLKGYDKFFRKEYLK